MKNKTILTSLFIALSAVVAVNFASAEVGHDHGAHADHGVAHYKTMKAPNGGRIIDSVEPHLEFYVTPDRFVQITFLDAHGQAIPFTEDEISAIGGDRSSPITVEFERKGDVLVSEEPLPEMKNMPIVLIIKDTSEATTVREKFTLNMSGCPTCSHKEYACVCAH
ncbi:MULTISPECIES: hypothetical protein [unclassified Lentimonas]|uniref:hypothetical protein n=1 Tax=unclassified Lentimonas TaxID=2630993 RepID=UPI00132A1087|nr:MULTISPECIES: hypothetical protein [unclassified Lentimonas]CAA6694231.1 Unannotated [Lentimonas sp. CC19]CAA6694276.1 Unannotated [Lentimonas sp. CC10]CAA7071039.1 Unannotated [Lentimonas sp. CC11]